MNIDHSRIPGSLELGDTLAGGVVSEVCAAKLLLPEASGHIDVVIKYTSSEIGDVKPPFNELADRGLLEGAHATHHIDALALRLLQDHPHIKVPRLHHYDEQDRVTIMDDFRNEGFTLMQHALVEGKLPEASARQVGDALGRLQLRLREEDFKNLEFAEDPQVQVLERLEELLPLLRDDLSLYNEIKAKFLEASGPVHVDGHPKNIGVDNEGNVVLIDFGRMILANEQYPAPNFAAHIALAVLGGLIPVKAGVKYIREFVEAYYAHIPLEEIWFVRFFLAELVHRGLAMRWIDKRMVGEVPPKTYKLAVYGLFLDAIRDVVTIDELLALLEQAVPKTVK
jgi:hypothetical protein